MHFAEISEEKASKPLKWRSPAEIRRCAIIPKRRGNQSSRSPIFGNDSDIDIDSRFSHWIGRGIACVASPEGEEALIPKIL
jgi:hypothetical protein